jgi:apolipoprotein N-acyltransferase
MASQGITRSRAGIATALPLQRPAGALPPLPVGPRPVWPALATAGLLWLCYFPAAFGPLAWVALLPLLCLVRLPRARWRFPHLAAFAGGLAFYLGAIQWIRVSDWRQNFTWVGLSLYCALYFPLFLFLVRLLDRRTRLPLVVGVPAVWTALEFLRSTFGTGFSWYLLAHSQHDALPVIQISDLTGAYGVSFLVAAVNALLFEVLYGLRGFREWLAGLDAPRRWGRAALLTQALGVAGLLLGTLAYGVRQLGHQDFGQGPRIALVQGNLDQRIKNDSSISTPAAEETATHFRDLTDLAAWYHPELIVLPETSYPWYWVEVAPGQPSPESADLGQKAAERWRTSVLLGLNAEVHTGPKSKRLYNSAVLIREDGKPAGRYDKIHRVPFGEYVPLRDWLPWMEKFAPYDFEYSVTPGESFTRFELPSRVAGRTCTFGALICYEDTDPEVALPYGGGDGKPAADFVLNISNDGWFNGTSEHDQHLAVCRFRAVECRRCVARSVNMGISAVIDGNGRVLAPQRRKDVPRKARPLDARVWEATSKPGAPGLPVSQWRNFKKVPGVLIATVPLDDRVSLYARWGDWLPWACWAVVGLGIAWALVRKGERGASERRAGGVSPLLQGERGASERRAGGVSPLLQGERGASAPCCKARC